MSFDDVWQFVRNSRNNSMMDKCLLKSDEAMRYISRLSPRLETPLQRLRNLKVMTQVVSDVANGRTSLQIGKLVIDLISAMDSKAEEEGVEDPIASASEP